MLKAIPRSCHLLWILENLLGATGETSEIVSKGCLQASATAELTRPQKRAWRRLVFLVEAELLQKPTDKPTDKATGRLSKARQNFAYSAFLKRQLDGSSLMRCDTFPLLFGRLSWLEPPCRQARHFWSKESSTSIMNALTAPPEKAAP